MEIAKNTHAAVIVSSDWRHVGAVKFFIGPSDNPNAVEDGSSILEGQVLDAVDQLGLWFELNTEQKKWPDLPVQKLMIPWRFVLAIVLQPDLEAKQKGIGYPASTEGSSGSPSESHGGKFAV